MFTQFVAKSIRKSKNEKFLKLCLKGKIGKAVPVTGHEGP
jgi:hypothetical protein